MSTGIGSSAFTGSSSFSAQLQAVIQNSVAMASAPVQQLQRQQTTLTQQQTELQSITSDFTSLQSALQSITQATGLGSYSASVQDTSVATASVSTEVMAGTYNLNVISTGSQTNTISQNGLTRVSDPSSGNIGFGFNYALSVNGKTYHIQDSTGSLNGLAQAIINSGADVQATVVNIGGSSSPDYRLSVQSLDYAPDAIQLNDGTDDLLNTLSTGSYVSYQLNGQPSTPITSNTRNINPSPGLSVQIVQAGSTSISVAQSSSNLASALSTLAVAYNSTIDELSKNRGQSGGALSGQSVIYDLQSQLSSLGSYSGGTGNVTSLADLGLTFNQAGYLQFDAGAFGISAAASSAAILNFLGSATGGGFLQTATNVLNSATDSQSGSLSQASKSLSDELQAVGTKITDEQSKISQLQETLTTQMAASDAAISSLEQQVTEITTLFSTMQTYSRANSG